MKQIKNTLNDTLLEQDFSEEKEMFLDLDKYKIMAQTYANIENAIVVLSDMKENKSYIYHGLLAHALGLEHPENEIESIWEEEIFAKMHSDDLLEKHVLELQFFQYLKTISLENRPQYYTTCRIRMRNASDQFIWIQHRMYYVANLQNGSIWLSLCLYNAIPENVFNENFPNQIIHSFSGKAIIPDKTQSSTILSTREIEILQLIRQGKMSKEIAHQLSISNNTVNRHRQNILEKLRVDNSMEACRVAEKMQLL
ncbi:response regulator transcription factor [Rhizosphaericola mali]|uniref:Response regulator transcription factor n=1 Tax=Rhizosphaericola mali TaxID=2545455 RepID=A0A5P2G2W1_9BACT|nr:LuxR C-terminal-related transcriptional regulator [Rhizosphaericola mali]QES88162.1 response regulator transcription factor [Rhizosphaericola mali]